MAPEQNKTSKNLHRIEQIAGIVFVALIVLGCMIVLKPFVTAILWACILCFATWPLYRRLDNFCKGRKNLSAALMTLLITLVLVVPFAIAGLTFADDVYRVAERIKSYKHDGVPTPPEWLQKLPAVGQYAANYWNEMATNTDKAAVTITKWFNKSMPVIVKVSIALGQGILQLALSVLIAFFFYRDGPIVVERVSAGIKQIAGDYGLTLIGTVGGTIKSVVHGLLGTALAQGIMGGIGYTIAGIPGALLWALLTFFLALLPFGPPLVWVPATIWLFVQGHTGMGIFMAIWGFVGISGIDNVVRPLLISKGTTLPFALILLGVLGGLAAWGFLGIFLGPTLLAAGYCLVQEFLRRGNKPAQAKAAKVIPLTDSGS